jgi:hypothetical protein
MNRKLTADQRTCQELMRSWQSDADKPQGKIDRMASENERRYLVNQQLMEANKELAVDRQHLQAVQEPLDLAIVRLDRYADELERANQKRTDQDSAVHSLMGKLIPSHHAQMRASQAHTSAPLTTRNGGVGRIFSMDLSTQGTL